jgi:hypothetical protein
MGVEKLGGFSSRAVGQSFLDDVSFGCNIKFLKLKLSFFLIQGLSAYYPLPSQGAFELINFY